MDAKIFLQSHLSKKSSNTSNGVNVQFKGRRKLLPTNDVSEIVSQYDQYLLERESCNKIRLTCQVNPICTNVLFNPITEIVRYEGSNNVELLNYLEGKGSTDLKNTDLLYKTTDVLCSSNLNGNSSSGKHHTNAIRDTQLSNTKNGFIYHCGLDILNNHLIRSNTFKTICRRDKNSNSDSNVFNTIGDTMRDVSGNQVIETLYFPVSSSVEGHKKDVEAHIYRYDDILQFDESISNRLIKKYDGWVGFYNRSKIKSYSNFENGDIMDIERPIMYKNGGDFIEMYPDRSLYSFVPKFNKYRNRIEKNWEYCITYPSSSTTEGFESIINGDLKSLKAIYFDENSQGDNGGSQLVIYGITKHGLKVGDFVNIYNTYIEDGKTVNEVVAYSAEVTNVVDDYIFILQGISSTISDTWCYLSDMTKKENDNETLSYNDVEYKNHSNKYLTKSGSNTKYYIINNKYVNLDDKAQNISYKKVVNGVECDYYVRVFEKVPNFKNASAVTSSEYDIYKNDSELIHEYQDKKYDFESHVSRLAFAKNIYGDDVGEIVFTDDIDISNLIDNLGRPISTLYIMFFKSNKGYKEWYGFYTQEDIKKNDKRIDINSDNVTYSHCFGMLTCGYETSDESICNSDIDSIYTINNIGESSQGISISKLNKGRGDYYHDTEIAYDVDKKFYGDICCYDGYNIVEESIQPIMHRFNTAQRESSNSLSRDFYQKFNYDNIIYDDYDINQNFTIKTDVVKNVNQKKEGYYYKPFYPIEIKTFGSLNSVSPDFLKIIGIKKYDGENGRYYSISTLSYHYLSPGDKSMIYDTEQDKYYTLVTIKNNDSNYKKFYFVAYDEKGTEKVDLDISDYSKFKLFKIDNLEVSSHASLLKDGTCRFVWSDLYNNGFAPTSAKSAVEYPFTNGAFYINKRIDIYVRRQDPYGVYGLYDGVGIGADISGDDSYTEVVSDNNYVKSDDIKC